MAGIPGCGKTEFVQNLIKQKELLDFVVIEHDKLVEHLPDYKADRYYQYRQAGSVLVSKLLDRCLKNQTSFILDGTLSSDRAESNIRQCFKNGYTMVYVIYIRRNAADSWDLTQAREQKTKRKIEKEGFIATCNRINSKLLTIFKTHHSKESFAFVCLDKDELLILDNYYEEDVAKINKCLTKPYNLDTIR